jgi:nucleoid-associated protein YgaU
MDDKTKKKTIFDRAIDAVSNRDEKAAAEAAKVEAEAAKKEAADLRAKLAADKAQAEMKAKMAGKVAEHNALVQKAAADKAAAEKAAAEKAAADKAAAEKAAAEAAKPVKKYVLLEGETWSHVALKFYGHATPPYWQVLIDANKATVGEDYHRIWAGMEIIIPELPEELKKKSHSIIII